MYTRPTIRRSAPPPSQFTSRVQGRAIVSEWTTQTSIRPVPNGTPGRAGEIIDSMRRGTDCVKRPEPTPWTPPIDYEWYAKKMGLGPAYVKRCEEWFAEHPRVEDLKSDPFQAIDPEPIVKLMAKYSKKGNLSENGYPQSTRPPIEKMAIAWECAGYTKEQIEIAIARDQARENQMEFQQQRLDEIFKKYPSSSKPTPKAKKKIKAVKKKMAH